MSDTFDPLIDQLPSRFVVGIDLGTTNSAVTWIDTEEHNWKINILSIPQLVAAGEIESLDTLPSFHFQPPRTGQDEAASLKMGWDKKNPKYCVGAYARDETAKTSGRGIASAKSWLCHAAVDRSSELLPWHGADDVQRLSPVEVSSRYLKHIRKAWDQQFPNDPLADQDIVLTLPASFDEIARELTIQAAAHAGLKRVVLIEEPQAAFYAWVYQQGDDWESRVSIGQKILVCDIGGGTTDFTLIRVRKSNESHSNDSETDRTESNDKLQFHRVAVGNHLILGGDNLDLAIAKYLEQKLNQGKPLESYQLDVLIGISRNLKEQMLANHQETSATVSLPGRGAKLLGSSLKAEVTSSEIQKLILGGFLPEVSIADRPQRHASGFQEFGLPYASDPAITKYLAEFLVTHATAGQESHSETPTNEEVRPDVVLFNGGFFASPVLRQTTIERIRSWFAESDADWSPNILDNDRLDLAVARGAAYYGMVRRNEGVRIAASLARSYYISLGGQPEQVICLLPGNAEAGQTFELDRTFQLTISQPVEFSIYVSSTRLADAAGELMPVDPEQMKTLPPIRTALRAKSRNEKRDIPVRLRVGLTEIGTIDLSCHEVDSDRSWKLQFDVRSATQTDLESHQGLGETEGFVDETTWQSCEQAIADVFGEANNAPPKSLVKQLTEITGMDRYEWPMSLLRRIWAALMDHQEGRRKSAAHESRWLNLLGFSLRPGYGLALDDWRVTETWRHVNGKLAFGTPAIRNESLILWRRLAGGLTRGQQTSIADPLLAALRSLSRKLQGLKIKNTTVLMRPEESVEVWRLLGSLEWLSPNTKHEIGSLIVSLKDKPKLSSARDAMIWSLGRLGQRAPIYGPLNSVMNAQVTEEWINSIIAIDEAPPSYQLAVVQMSRVTNDRYRDLDSSFRDRVVRWLERQSAQPRWVELVQEYGTFDAEEQGKLVGESLPQGLRLE
ncbi:MAG: Hsp70 family protein [Planctomycetota bacterium]